MPDAAPSMPTDQRALAQLTPRELEVLHLMADGLGIKGLAQRLGISTHAVEWQVEHLMEKLQAHSTLRAVIGAARQRHIEL